jgi:20S proteasome alpha/beta subunit
MTLAVALRAVNGLVLATDSRVTGRGGSADVSTKFLQVNRDIGAMTYGLAAPGYRSISSLVAEVGDRSLAHFSKIDELAGEVIERECRSWWQRASEEMLPGGTVGVILAGFDGFETRQFQIRNYEIRFEADQEVTISDREIPGDLLAAQWHVSRYLMNKLFLPSMTVSQLVELALVLFVETMTVEDSVGGQIVMATVTKAEGFQRVHEREVDEILERTQDHSARFSALLYRELVRCLQS